MSIKLLQANILAETIFSMQALSFKYIKSYTVSKILYKIYHISVYLIKRNQLCKNAC